MTGKARKSTHPLGKLRKKPKVRDFNFWILKIIFSVIFSKNFYFKTTKGSETVRGQTSDEQSDKSGTLVQVFLFSKNEYGYQHENKLQ